MIELFYGLVALGVFWAISIEENMHSMPVDSDFWVYTAFALFVAALWPALLGVVLYTSIFSEDNEND